MPRAVVFDEIGAPDVLYLIDEPLPEPAAGEVRVRIEAFGVNPVEQMMRSGAYPAPFPLPRARIGLEGTGRIDALGADVVGLAVGDPVIIAAVPQMHVNGVYAEYTTVPAASVIPRPAELDAVGAAAFWTAHATAYGALVESAGLRPGDRLLINSGSSAVGLAALGIARQLGVTAIAVTRHSAKREALLAAGAESVVATDRDELPVGTVDLVLDTVRGPGLARLAAAARMGGTLISVGWSDPRPPTYPSGLVTMMNYMGLRHTTNPDVLRRIAAFLGAGLRCGTLQPTVDRVFALDEVVAAHEYLEKGQHFGKIVVTV
ncbi:zinc-dependent alcohol dehydrogenase family protein [Spongisporangium articulatum]|uniref:Zinc-dependent alcohol dehydrogenase family protein n=1 Tax=Spongisporangium articulatum TaxID=3362603 RepID=A0ABW8ALV3_9ACTN